jgi:hypothetical protein
MAFGIEAGVGHMGPHFRRNKKQEAIDKKHMGGFDAWVVLDCSPMSAFWSGYDPLCNAEPTSPSTEDDLEGLDQLIEESVVKLEEITGMEVPALVRRVVVESVSIGVAVADE